MWLSFLASMLLTAGLLYIPGFLLVSAFGHPRRTSLLLSPPIALALYGILEIIEQKIGIKSSVGTVVGVSLCISIIPLLVKVVMQKLSMNAMKRDANAIGPDGDVQKRHDWLVLFGFWTVGIFITTFVLVRNFDGPDSYSQLFDNAWHMGIVRKFLTTGDMSPLTSGNIVPTVGSSFYPTGWHSLVALVAGTAGVSPLIAANAVNACIIAVVFPGSMFLLLKKVLSGLRPAMILCMCTTLMFTAFPWRFLAFGPLYSNLLSFAVLPLSMVLFLNILDARSSWRRRAQDGALLIATMIGVAITQPNAVFTMGIFLVPYLMTQIPRYCDALRLRANRTLTVFVLSAVVLLLIACVWVGLYKVPFMQRIVRWDWPSFETKPQAIFDIVFLGFRDAEPQFILGILVMLGFLYVLLHREYLWLGCAHLLMCFLYFLSAATDGRFKAVLTGFWYHDAYRLGASAVFTGIPLAAIGLWSLMNVIVKLLDGVMLDGHDSRQRIVLFAAVLVVVEIINFFPNYHMRGSHSVDTPFGAVTRDLRYTNSRDEPKSYTADERRFVEKVRQIVPSGSLILNQPYDGSVYAWGIDDLNVYYKAWQGNWLGKPTAQSKLIMNSLDSMDDDQHVCQAVKESNAQYLMLLDRTDYKPDPDDKAKVISDYASYKKRDWRGIDAVHDGTPGFTPVLQQGVMRLYRIDSHTC